jgi:selenocysteine-specific translation elongation factor
VRVGDAIAVLPSGTRSFVERIVAFDGDLDQAVAGQSVTLTLTDEVDCSRGDLIAATHEASEPVSRLSASLVWMSDEKLVPHRSYWLKAGTQTVSANVDTVDAIIDVNTLAWGEGQPLGLNDIGKVEIDLDRAIPAVRYEQNRKLGGFILIDKISHATVAAGLIEGFPSNPVKASVRHAINWVTGSKRIAWATSAAARLKAQGRSVAIVDDAAISGFPQGEPAQIAREVARLMAAAGVQVFVTVEGAATRGTGTTIDSDQNDEGGDEWVI